MQDLLKTLNVLISKIENLNVAQPLTCYTVKEVAEKLKASENSVYNMIQSGILEAFTVGDIGSKKPVYRITNEALEKYIKASSLDLRKEVAFNG